MGGGGRGIYITGGVEVGVLYGDVRKREDVRDLDGLYIGGCFGEILGRTRGR